MLVRQLSEKFFRNLVNQQTTIIGKAYEYKRSQDEYLSDPRRRPCIGS
jgi:hypothetical protein